MMRILIYYLILIVIAQKGQDKYMIQLELKIPDDIYEMLDQICGKYELETGINTTPTRMVIGMIKNTYEDKM